MKGQIKKTDYGWIVVWSHPMEYREPEHELPLHPKDIELFNQFEKIFDNFEARVLASPEVDFEISWWADGEVPKQYAKLKNTMLNNKPQKPQSSIEWLVTQYEIKFGVSITKVMADEIALAKQKFEQEIEKL